MNSDLSFILQSTVRERDDQRSITGILATKSLRRRLHLQQKAKATNIFKYGSARRDAVVGTISEQILRSRMAGRQGGKSPHSTQVRERDDQRNITGILRARKGLLPQGARKKPRQTQNHQPILKADDILFPCDLFMP